MKNGNFLLRSFKKIGLILILGVAMSACASNTFTWKEEVLLHDGQKIIVERTDTYDPSMRHEIGQGAPLAEHQTTFVIPGTGQTVVWKSDNRSLSEPDDLHLTALDFLNGVPYAATKPFGCFAYNKWERPNPPYVFFNYDGKAWNSVSLEEFPEKFNINVSLHFNEQEQKTATAENREFGFLRAQTVKKINQEPGRSKESYSIIRTPLKAGSSATVDCAPIYSGFKAPFPIAPSNSVEEKK